MTTVDRIILYLGSLASSLLLANALGWITLNS